MIRCTIEMIPHGDEAKVRTLGIVEIANDASGDLQNGNYVVVLKKTPPWKGALKAKWRGGLVKPGEEDAEVICGRVEGLDRARRGPYDLLYRALQSCGLGARNSPGAIFCGLADAGKGGEG